MSQEPGKAAGRTTDTNPGTTPGATPGTVSESFPRQHARTRRFTLGEPRAFTVAPDGSRVAFLRSAAGDDPVNRLWVLDLPAGIQRCVADPAELGGEGDGDLPPEERARRERVRESAGGITAYATDEAVGRAVFTLAGRGFVADLASGECAAIPVDGPVIDPRLDPAGTRVAFVRDGALHVAGLEGADERMLAADDDPDVTWGLAEFVAAEEMGRLRGFWWSPEGTHLAVARVDVRQVDVWHVTDPAEPGQDPAVLRYPAAGTANADVSLEVVGLDGTRVPVIRDRSAGEYLADVRWEHGHLLLTVQSRDQRSLEVLSVDPRSGSATARHREQDPHWVELVPGVPRLLPDGRLLHCTERDDTRRLAIDGAPLTPAGLHVREVLGLLDAGVLVSASTDDPTAVGLWQVPLDGGSPEALSGPAGVHGGTGAGALVVVQARGLDHDGVRTHVRHPQGRTAIDSHAETPMLTPRVALAELGPRSLRSALLLPSGHQADDGPLPVLLDPYGGPHAQRVLQARAAFGVPQWFADAGYAVLVVDGRGTPGRGSAWERSIAGDLASAPLEDQVDALHAAAEQHPGTLDLERVAIRGWSFGGYLAALAVLRRPDVFHAAIAGAPVTDWRMYDTHYTERYLGDPRTSADAYSGSSLLEDAKNLQRPLMLIHGLADDNVVAAHTLRLSRALLEAGRPHQVLPLVGVTHMTPQETVAEALLLLQLRFLTEALHTTAHQ